MMDILSSGARRLGFAITRAQLAQFQIYYEELTAWNRRFNLTAITAYEDVQIKHFLDSLTVALASDIGRGRPRVLDIGSGAGLPGIPLKILFPGIGLVLLEATAKKTEFLQHLKGRLGLDGVEIVTGRAEEVAHREPYREQFDIVVARAVAPLPALAEMALAFCAPGGRFVAQKKGDIAGEIERAGEAITVMGGALLEIKRVDLAEFTGTRQLVIIRKVNPSPPQYPRRPGMPVKKPLR